MCSNQCVSMFESDAYQLEKHVCNHIQAHDDLLEYSADIEWDVPGPAQKVEYPINIINCIDITL